MNIWIHVISVSSFLFWFCFIAIILRLTKVPNRIVVLSFCMGQANMMFRPNLWQAYFFAGLNLVCALYYKGLAQPI